MNNIEKLELELIEVIKDGSAKTYKYKPINRKNGKCRSDRAHKESH